VRALWDGARRISDAAGLRRAAGEDPFTGLVAALSEPQHRDELASSCALATLGADVARSSARTRAAYGTGGELSAGDRGTGRRTGPAGRRRRAMLVLSALVGAVTMGGRWPTGLSAELLELVGQALLDPPNKRS